MIGIIDYGVGNVQAFLNVYSRFGMPACRVNSVETLRSASRFILPGVGHFDHAMTMLNESGMKDCLSELVLEHDVSILGICVGMQMIADGSEEGTLPGLGWVPGYVRRFQFSARERPFVLPHMGWNSISVQQSSPLLDHLGAEEARLYFLHSYYFDPDDGAEVYASANYGIEFAAVVGRGNIFGVQCHPEKSHGAGEQILKNFGEL